VAQRQGGFQKESATNCPKKSGRVLNGERWWHSCDCFLRHGHLERMECVTKELSTFSGTSNNRYGFEVSRDGRMVRLVNPRRKKETKIVTWSDMREQHGGFSASVCSCRCLCNS
jgi:hypothetical protein